MSKAIRTSSTILKIDGIIIGIVAIIHMVVIPELTRFFKNGLSLTDFNLVWPVFLLNHAVVGILMMQLSVSTFYAAAGLKKRAKWAYYLSLLNALTMLSISFVIIDVVDRKYFGALPFMIAICLVMLVGMSMLWPIVALRKEQFDDPDKSKL